MPESESLDARSLVSCHAFVSSVPNLVIKPLNQRPRSDFHRRRPLHAIKLSASIRRQCVACKGASPTETVESPAACRLPLAESTAVSRKSPGRFAPGLRCAGRGKGIATRPVAAYERTTTPEPRVGSSAQGSTRERLPHPSSCITPQRWRGLPSRWGGNSPVREGRVCEL
jgi:hypothetical protein